LCSTYLLQLYELGGVTTRAQKNIPSSYGMPLAHSILTAGDVLPRDGATARTCNTRCALTHTFACGLLLARSALPGTPACTAAVAGRDAWHFAARRAAQAVLAKQPRLPRTPPAALPLALSYLPGYHSPKRGDVEGEERERGRKGKPFAAGAGGWRCL